jgi:hypothetical protein
MKGLRSIGRGFRGSWLDSSSSWGGIKCDREVAKSAKTDAKKCILATDKNQMHTDKTKLHFHLCASDFYLWLMILSAAWLLIFDHFVEHWDASAAGGGWGLVHYDHGDVAEDSDHGDFVAAVAFGAADAVAPDF